MKRRDYLRIGLLAAILPLLLNTASAESELPYRVQQNVVYAEAHGIGLLADIFTPKGAGNGAAIVEVASGAWHSDRGKIRDLTKARVFEILCGRGYTVFAIRPGSISKFSALEMVKNVERGIAWVKSNADEYQFDADRLGLMRLTLG